MTEPVLVIMAAGMGSRYGGLKQTDSVDCEGHLIIDFSIYDAVRAGFKKVICVIKKEIEKEFKEKIGYRLEKNIDVEYVYQDLNNLPEGFNVPKERVKPFGTAHAVLSCINRIDGPFAVINADDYYGKHAFEMIYDYLINTKDDEKYNYTMVGYKLENTLTDNGHVARGVCEIGKDGFLHGITERTHIEKIDGKAMYTEDGRKSFHEIKKGSTVSMNMWGFTKGILYEINDRFSKFLSENLETNPLKCEYFLPSVIGELLKEKKARVHVLKSLDKWYGVTYKEDKENVVKAIKELKESGIYPKYLWDNNETKELN